MGGATALALQQQKFIRIVSQSWLQIHYSDQLIRVHHSMVYLTFFFFFFSFHISAVTLKKPPLHQYMHNIVHNMFGLRGISPKFALTFNDAFEAAGLQNVQHDHRSIPVGWGPLEIASISAKVSLTTCLFIRHFAACDFTTILPLFFLDSLFFSQMQNVLSIFESLKPTVTLTLGLSSKEYDEMSADCMDEFAKYKTYWNLQFAYGQKPLK